MRKLTAILSCSALVALAAVATASAVFGQAQQAAAPAQGQARGAQPPQAPPKPRPGHPSGKLIVWGDVALFESPGEPDNCVQTNRYKRGQRIGFRMAAIDGGTGEPENTAVLTVHLTAGGKTIDIPMRFRGSPDPNASAPQPRGYLRPITNLWTGWWMVPGDARTGVLSYSVTATDQFGRTATFEPFSYDTSQLTIVQ